MINDEIAKIFFDIANYLKAQDIPFKPQAYEKAALILQNMEQDIKEVYEKGGIKALKALPGIGESMAQKIQEYIETGKIQYYEELKKQLPVNLTEISAIEGVGPKRAKVLYERLGIKTLDDLEKAAKEHKICKLFGFGEKTEKNILEGIEFVKKSKGRFLLSFMLPKAFEIKNYLSKIKGVSRVDFAGSLRRRKETIGDMDFLVVCTNPKEVIDYFVSMPGVVKVWGKGEAKSSVRMKEGYDIDLRVVSEDSYGSMMQYFTGSKDHNIVLRKIAIEKGMKLNEYGLFKGNKKLAGKDEREIYNVLGLDYIEPELRENRGEIECALKGCLPKIIGYHDIKGDLHTQTEWNGGENSVEEMALAAFSLGYEYIGISDHTQFLKIEHGLSEKDLLLQRKEIDKINNKFKDKGIKIKILQGAETNIMPDGSLDISNDVLSKLDYAIGGVHSSMKMSKQDMTKRIIKAMENPYINIIAHPTGRILQRRDEYEVDIDLILKKAKETNTILEINAYPERLDLNDINIKKAKEMRVKMIINTDAHHIDHLRYMEYGIAQARRGWAEKKDIVNTWKLEDLLKEFQKKRKLFGVK